MTTDSSTTDQRVTVTYQTQGDVRRLVFYMASGDGVQSDGSLGGPLTQIIQKFAAVIPHDDSILSIVGNNPDKTTFAAASGFPTTNATYSYNKAMSILAYHFVCKDSQGRNCGHTVHLVAQGDTGNAKLEIGEAIANINDGAAWLAFVNTWLGHTNTRHGHAYETFMHVRLVLKRDRATGGRGRKMTEKRAVAFLRKHKPGDLSSSAPGP